MVDSQTLIRSAILKPYISPLERDVLLLSFESELMKLALIRSFLEIERHYKILFLPSCQPFYSDALFKFRARARQLFGIMPSSSGDQSLCAELGKLHRPLLFQVSSWVTSRLCPDSRLPKAIDIRMLANFSRYKRQWRLVRPSANFRELYAS
jgi:hypothetical protein